MKTELNSAQTLGLPLQLKPVSMALILAELLDVATTLVGFLFFPQIWEANPLLITFGGWMQLLLAKLVAVAFVVLILEKVKTWPRLVWIIPLVASLPALWNTFCLLAEIIW
jgi:uncharacterized membrane protein